MASESSPASTPMVLTPDSTGNNAHDTAPTVTLSQAQKKNRRQTAFYPVVNSSNKVNKPFSRSAAKRSSVMALGSIEYLQHYFTKTGIAAKKNPLANKPHYGGVPAIGGLARIRTGPSIGSIAEFELPPSPAIPQNKHLAYPVAPKAHDVNPEYLLPGVIEDLNAVSAAWGISIGADAPPPSLRSHQLSNGEGNNIPLIQPEFDVLETLKLTTRAIRTIRNYLISLPDESAGLIRANFRPTFFSPAFLRKVASSVDQKPDALSLIRKSALEVLTVLRDLEEKCRLPLSDDAYDVQSDGAGSGRGGGAVSPGHGLDDDAASSGGGSTGGRVLDGDMVTYMHVSGRSEAVPVWEEDEDIFAEEEPEKRESWEEKLVLGNGWLYRRDVKLSELSSEREIVETYLDVVDEILFGNGVDGKASRLREPTESAPQTERAWEKERKRLVQKDGSLRLAKAIRRRASADVLQSRLALGVNGVEGDLQRRVSTGMMDVLAALRLEEELSQLNDAEDEEGEQLDDEYLPNWAKRSMFVDDELSRAHAMLAEFLPSKLINSLESPTTSREAFLTSLSSGQLLCTAYNTCVRRSKKPWGYINKDSIHDILTLEKEKESSREELSSTSAGAKSGWTFRRSDNLRLWAGALKLRYEVPILIPTLSLPPVIAAPVSLLPSAASAGSGMVSPANSNTPANGNTPASSPGPSKTRFLVNGKVVDDIISFDIRLVARKEESWQDMLETVLLRWVSMTVDETRRATIID